MCQPSPNPNINQTHDKYYRNDPVEHSSNPFYDHDFIEFYLQQSSSPIWIFREVGTLLPDQENKEKIKRALNFIDSGPYSIVFETWT